MYSNPTSNNPISNIQKMNKIYFLSILCTLSLYLSAQTNEQLLQLFEKIEATEKLSNPNTALGEGKHPEKLAYLDGTAYQNLLEKYLGQSTQLKAIADIKLDRQDQISKAIMLHKLDAAINEIKYQLYLIPFNAEGGFFNQATFYLPNLPFENIADYEAYLKWLPSVANYIKGHQKLLEKGIQEGIVAPQVITKNIIQLLQVWVDKDVKKNPYAQPFYRLPEGITDKMVVSKGEQIISKKIIPAYQELLDFFSTKYLAASPTEVGISKIKNGKTYYENLVNHFTTLNISPDSVFNIGQEEVARIKTQMELIIKDLDFEGSFADFFEFLRTDPQFFPKTGQELLNYAAWISKKAEGELPRLFGDLYSLPFTVAPVPDAIAPNYTTGRYVPGDRSQNKPGTYWVNTYNLESRTLYTLPALTLHEAVPGHHLQIMKAAELSDLPDFRKSYYISAFGEGWALYSEYLGEEMGIYKTPYELFGRYTYEMWRACRLVVDVGLHYKGWTRAEAITFMAENTALSLHEVNTEIDRYIGWPGQALSYKMGEITIKNLRTQAEKELGEAFDIQAFHELILKNGSVTLPILIEEVEAYIKTQKK